VRSTSRPLPEQARSREALRFSADTHSTVAGRTFRYSETGPEGLCGGKKVIIVSTAGGLHVGQPTSVGHEDLIKVLFGFIGVTDLQFVFAHGLAYGDEPRANAMASARKHISEALFATA